MKNNINGKNKKILVAKKIKEECYLREVKEYFEDKNKYLQIDKNITVGNQYYRNKNIGKLNNIKYNSLNETNDNHKRSNTIDSNYTKYKKNSIKSYSRPNTAKEITLNSRNNCNLFLNYKSKKIANNYYYEMKSPHEIVNIFNYYRNIHKNSTDNKDYIPEKASDIFKKKYFIQEKTLINNQKNKEINKKISKFLSKTCNKKNLLVNSSNKFLLKKQLINYLYKNKILQEKFGDYYWILNLKRSDKNNKEYKTNFVNTGNKFHENWNQYFDPGNNDLELIVNPNSHESALLDKEEKFKFLKTINDLKIDGKNLLENEYNIFIDLIKNKKNKAKIKLYKDPSDKKIKNIRNLLFKQDYLKSQNNINKEKPLKKSYSLCRKQFSININYKAKLKENNLIYL